jgi:hypothetical protein
LEKIKLVLFLAITIFYSNNIYAQNWNDKSFYGGLNYITNYMVSDEYRQFSKGKTDLELVDYLYKKTLIYFDNDASETFFCLTFSFLPYNRILMRFPVLRFKMTIPLPSPPQVIFDKKLKVTPKKLFVDSPNDDFGDKDKLAHFFSNAFIHYNVNIFNLSEFLGIFVEFFEQEFFIQGGYDYRDLVVNHLGELFADMVKNNTKSKPSEALLVYQLLFINTWQ